MDKENLITVTDMTDKAYLEILRLGYKKSASSRHSKELREFSVYCEKSAIIHYGQNTGTSYFLHRYGLDMTDPTIRLTKQQCKARCSVRLLDDIYHFGYARRYSHHDYRTPTEYSELLEEYLEYCIKNRGAKGTIRVKRTKLRQFLCYLEGREISITDMTPADISDFMITLACYTRSTIHIFTSVMSCFFRYLQETGVTPKDLSPFIPKPRIYAEESIPETWTPEEVRQLLTAIDRTSNIGKRDYAMALLAVILGMRVGDICALRFKDFDWNRKLITYVQQKTNKTNTLPILPEIGEAVIDYLKNGRLESDCDNVFVRHISPYGALQSSSALSENIKRYMRYAGLTVKNRKTSHSLRHTLASSLLRDGTPLMTISNVLGHYNPRATVGYTKVDIPSLRKCSLSYGRKAAIK
jgi:site-specific recombinase XerD